MIQNQYVPVFNTASGTTVVQAAGNITIHTLNFPKATAGVVQLATGDGATVYIALPAAAIGSMRLDMVCPKGLSIWAASADVFITTVQTP